MIQAERRVKILEITDSKGVVSVKDLSRLLNTSLMTIRRDLDSLEENRLIKRTHGGVVSLKYEKDVPFLARTLKKEKDKIDIGRAAAGIVENKDIVYMDSGSTVATMAQFLKGKIGLKIVTPSIQIVNELYMEEGITLILLGGIVKGDLFCTVGSVAESELRNFHFQKAFIGTSGITLENGIFNSDFLASSLERIVIERSNKIYVLADSSKFGKNALINVLSLDAVEALITDRTISDEMVDLMKRNGVNLIKA